MFRLIFHPEASKEFSQAVFRYELNKKGLGSRFAMAVEILIIKIQNNPHLFGYTKATFREAAVPVFPYTIVFKSVDKKKIIYILAIFHTGRNPKKKYRRIL
jgi:hypothetical protein